MRHKTYGFVGLGSNKKQFTVLDKEVSGLVGYGVLPFGHTLKAGRVERMLDKFQPGDIVWCHYTTDLRTTKIKVGCFANVASKREINGMAGKFFVSILSVKSQVPQNIRSLDALGPAALIKTAWFTVSETGKPYTIPTAFDEAAALNMAYKIANESNATVALVDVDGNVALNTFGKPKVAPVVPEPKAPVEKAEKPTKSGYFYFEEDANIILSTVAGLYNGGYNGHVNIMATGESGTGKTTVAKKFADKMGWDCHRLNCALITEPMDIAGQRAVVNGQTAWEWSAVAKAISAGNCVIILDELNRAYSNALNALFGLLDDDRSTWFNDLELKVGPNVVFFATVNQGSEYTGTFQADAALLNRFQFVVEMGKVPSLELKKILTSNCKVDAKAAGEIVVTATLIKSRMPEVSVSVRTIKLVADAVSSGLSQRQAWQFVLVNRLDNSLRKDLVDLLNNNIGVIKNENIKLIF